jgi:hypothetical protein
VAAGLKLSFLIGCRLNHGRALGQRNQKAKP